MKVKYMIIFLISFLLLKGTEIFAHCDTMNGPVITAAKEALNKGDVKLVLIWVQPKDEDLVKDLFNQTLKLRKISPEVKQMADMHFFENLVRIHRAGEGFPYTGIKDEEKVEVPIATADNALKNGQVDEVLKTLHQAIDKGVKERFTTMMSRKNYSKSDVKAGREFVESYVSFIHYVEGLYNMAENKEEVHGQKILENSHKTHP